MASCYKYPLSIVTLMLLSVIALGCVESHQQARTPPIITEGESRPTPAGTLQELIIHLSSDETLVRVVSAYALRAYDPDEVVEAIPSLIKNLYHDYSEVQTSSAELLGALGIRSQLAVQDLIFMMENTENSLDVRRTAAKVLGQIGETSAIPALAKQLYQGTDTSYDLEIICANSIAILANQKFRDAGEAAYNFSNGIPWIVVDARSWWEQTGQYQEWGK